MRDIVMVISDLYLPEAWDGASPQALASFAGIPGLEAVARFGERRALACGWRSWLAAELGLADLAGVAPARIAACVPGADENRAAGSTLWIATPVHLSAGLTRVHLDHRGLLRLDPEELAGLSADFAYTFGSSEFSLAPLPSGEFLLSTPGILPLPTPEPARCAGRALSEVVPASGAAAPLQRLLAEIEMWLHGHRINEARAATGEPTVTTLWPWGAEGRALPPQPAAHRLPAAFGEDAWLCGVWHIHGSVCPGLPATFDDLIASGSERAVLVAETGGRMPAARHSTVNEGLARLDEWFISEAWGALRHGGLARLTVILNDTRVSVGRASRFRFWRRRRAALTGFACS